MFKIGEFSRLGRVTIDTLYHYDRVGLLKSMKVDPFTGYRYYSAKQLHTLNRILALKDVGFSLEEIAYIFQDALTDEEVGGMLKLQLVSAERDLQNAQSRLNRIKARLKHLNLEDSMTTYEVTLKSVDSVTVAAIREVVATAEQVPTRCNVLFNTIAQWMVKNNLPIGSPVTLYFNDSHTQENIDMECAFIIPDSKAVT